MLLKVGSKLRTQLNGTSSSTPRLIHATKIQDRGLAAEWTGYARCAELGLARQQRRDRPKRCILRAKWAVNKSVIGVHLWPVKLRYGCATFRYCCEVAANVPTAHLPGPVNLAYGILNLAWYDSCSWRCEQPHDLGREIPWQILEMQQGGALCRFARGPTRVVAQASSRNKANHRTRMLWIEKETKKLMLGMHSRMFLVASCDLSYA